MSHLGGPRVPYGAVMIESLKACGGPGFLVLLVASAALVVAVVAAAVAFSGRRKAGSVLAGTALFLAGATLHLFATTSMAIFMATLARSMP